MSYEPRLVPIQKELKCAPDGILGNETLTALEREILPEMPSPADITQLPPQSQRTEVYGQPHEGFPLVPCILPYEMSIAWDRSSKLRSFYCHKLVKDRFQAMFEGWLEHFDEDGIRQHGLDLYGGCYNHRSTRGGSSWSDHAYGIAIDINPDGNGLHTPWDKENWGKPGYGSMPADAIKIAEDCCLRNIAASMGRDAMHLSAVDYGTI